MGQLNVVADKLSRPVHSDIAVSPSRGLPIDMNWVAQTSDRPVCYDAQQQTSSFCVISYRSPGLGIQPFIRGSGPISAFLPEAILGKVVAKVQDYPCRRIILIVPGWSNMPWL